MKYIKTFENNEYQVDDYVYIYNEKMPDNYYPAKIVEIPDHSPLKLSSLYVRDINNKLYYIHKKEIMHKLSPEQIDQFKMIVSQKKFNI